MTLHLDTVLAVLIAVPAIIALAQGKDGATRAWCGFLLVLTVLVGARYWVDFLDRYITGGLLQGMAVAIVVLGVIVAVRAASQIYGTLMITAAVLLALLHLRIVA